MFDRPSSSRRGPRLWPAVHPTFGPLAAEEWSRSHFKHVYHHLLQFGLLERDGGVG